MKTKTDLNYLTLLNKFTHNVSTPLATIKQSTIGLKDFLPKILDGYAKAKDANLISENIETQHLKILHNILAAIHSSADLINNEISEMRLALTSIHGD